MRICSLLPSATEIVCRLGLRGQLVAITHECDYPQDLDGIEAVTSSAVRSESMTSAEIDVAIRESLANLSTIYYLDRGKLAALQPDLVLTQELCEVCAVSFDRVHSACQAVCPGAEVVSLEPGSLVGILDSITLVAAKAGAVDRGEAMVSELRGRIESVSTTVQSCVSRPSVLALEWFEPFFTGGHWVPEMIALAGGHDAFGTPGERSKVIEFPDIAEADPDMILLMPCGFDLDRTVTEYRRMTFADGWNNLSAAREGRVYAVNGSAYFNRPGPRVVDGLETLANLLHPDAFGKSGLHEVVKMAPVAL